MKWVKAFVTAVVLLGALMSFVAYVVNMVVAFGGQVGDTPQTGTEVLSARIIAVVTTLIFTTVAVHECQD